MSERILGVEAGVSVDAIREEKPIEGAPKKGPRDRDMTVSEVSEREHPDAPERKKIRAVVPGLVVEAVDDDGHGLARVMSTLAAMVPDA